MEGRTGNPTPTENQPYPAHGAGAYVRWGRFAVDTLLVFPAMATVMPYEPQRHRRAVEELLKRIEAHVGRPALSEHKAVRLGGGTDVRATAAVDRDVVVWLAFAAWHPADAGPGHWGVELAMDPAHRRPEEIVAALASLRSELPEEDRHAVWAASDDVASAIERDGYHEVRRLYRLERLLPLANRRSLPPTVRIAPFRLGTDEAAWVAVNNAAFSGHPENGALTVADLKERFAFPWFNPDDLLMAWENDRLRGSCWTKVHPQGVGEIYIVGVAPEFQGKGLGRALVETGLDHLASARSCTTGVLYVEGDNDAAQWLYSELGFTTADVNRQFARRVVGNRF